MKKLCLLFNWVLIFISLGVFLNGCEFTRSIKVEYLPGSEDMNWIKNTLKESPPQFQPTIAISHFNDNRPGEDIGAVYSHSGVKVETLVLDEKAGDILDKALSSQLEKAGFKVIMTSGWNLHPEEIPAYLNVDFIIGGNIKVFWVESKAGLLTSTINSNIVYDLVIADARNKKIIWAGQISGMNQKKSLAHTNDYFWNDLQNSINLSLTQAINQALQDEQTRKSIITLIRIKF